MDIVTASLASEAVTLFIQKYYLFVRRKAHLYKHMNPSDSIWIVLKYHIEYA